ncbi:hypothetical protein R5R35_002753 [Gryllus longicercus]|uniref:Prostaglandin reductase 1 n=1 Tax=Gryllus longicercus TaxID=2509291 RepID=A0AAN9ZDM8_9ORTH
MVKTKKYILAKHFIGEPKLTDFKLVEEELPKLEEGEILCESLWLSVDPYMRKYTDFQMEGTVMPGGVVARIAESRDPEFPKGRYVAAYFGWRTRTIYNTREENKSIYPKPYLLPDFGDLPLSLGLGVLGMPGITANFGFLEVCEPQPGETVVVNGAAGAVGSIVGQIAKIVGCRVIGFAGSDAKVKWLKEKLRFDAAYNYKTTKISDALREAAPKGVDCFFDNVGGAFSNEVFRRMNTKGRVCVCGAIAGYNAGFENVLVPMVQPYILSKELKVQGFIVWNHASRWLQAIQENMRWINEGKIVSEETITEGFENAPKAFIGMLRGDNIGKAVVQI